MRKIEKEDPPEYLLRYIDLQLQAGVNLRYEHFDRKDDLLSDLIDEQYALCAYTGERIDSENAHVEHLKPQSKCEEELLARGGEPGKELCCDLHYDNMVAALTMEGQNQYGANEKGGWYDEDLFISPLDENCDDAFDFDLGGNIDSGDDDLEEAAEKTIEELRLDCPTLTEKRQGRLSGYLGEEYPLSGLDVEDLRTIRESVQQKQDGQLPKFSFVIRSVVETLLESIRSADTS